MIKSLTKRGSSYTLTIDQAILQLMKADGNTPFELSLSGDVLTIRPIREPSKFDRAVALTDEIMETQKEVFRKLAE